MSLFSRFFKKQNEQQSFNVPQGIQDFIDGKKGTLTSADIDPVGTELFNGFLKAMDLKKEGKLSEAEKLLIKSTEPPSIYKGHYRQLFRIWRQFNREDLKANNFQEVMNRVLKMCRLDDEMINEMLRYWSIQQNRKLPKDYFKKDRNLLISDAKALKKAATALQNEKYIALSEKLISQISKK
ncbi:MAG: hypothetical protein ACTJFM_13125 [Pseudoalteromonas sp.]